MSLQLLYLHQRSVTSCMQWFCIIKKSCCSNLVRYVQAKNWNEEKTKIIEGKISKAILNIGMMKMTIPRTKHFYHSTCFLSFPNLNIVSGCIYFASLWYVIRNICVYGRPWTISYILPIASILEHNILFIHLSTIELLI